MIIPTPDFDPLFAKDGTPFRDKMIRWIEREFQDMLGEDSRLLRFPGGLEKIQTKLALPNSVRQAA